MHSSIANILPGLGAWYWVVTQLWQCLVTLPLCLPRHCHFACSCCSVLRYVRWQCTVYKIERLFQSEHSILTTDQSGTRTWTKTNQKFAIPIGLYIYLNFLHTQIANATMQIHKFLEHLYFSILYSKECNNFSCLREDCNKQELLL